MRASALKIVGVARANWTAPCGVLGIASICIARYSSSTIHDLRHSHATLLLSQGVHPKIVQERPGHSQISVTMDTYLHCLPTMQREAAGRLHRLSVPSTASAPRHQSLWDSQARLLW
ncbi:MAG TPA: tyrosine-type recombinase/integrase [Pirellulales bacterium]